MVPARTEGSPNVPSRLRINVLANFFGRASGMLLAILFTPLYIHFLGIEAYGLIGFYLTLQASVSFLEMGLSRACNRELARHSGEVDAGQQAMLDTLRSLEVVYWVVAILLGIGFTLLAPWIASSWLNTSAFTEEQLSSILTIVAWVIALRWPMGLYTGAMMGMQRHVQMNMAQIGVSVLNGGGAVLVLWLVQPDIMAFFQWQLFSALCGVVLFASLAWRVLPGSPFHARFSIPVLRGIYRFAAGVGLNAILGTILRQADKLILSAILPLKQFGYYALVSVMASAVSMAADAVSNATFPRFSQMLGAGASAFSISALYHLASQVVAVLIIPLGLVVAVFAHEVLYVYTGNREIAENAALILSVLVVAKMLHASMLVPYALQLAYGWVRLSLYINIAAVIWLIPAIYILADRYGPVGASLAWLVVTIGYVVISMPLMHRKLLVGEWGRWAMNALLLPIITVAGFLLLARGFIGILPDSRWLQGTVLVGIGLLSILIAVLSTSALRNKIMAKLKVREF